MPLFKRVDQLPAATGVTGTDYIILSRPSGPTGTVGTRAATLSQLLTYLNTNGGATGPTGASGIGSTGPTGAAGSVGATGPQGDAGTAGAAGATGPTGAAGSNGAASTVTGPTGPAGAAGSNGAAGSSGVISVTAPITNSGTSTSAILGIDLTAPGAIGGTTPAAGTFTVVTATSRANLPSGAAGSPDARDLYAVADTIRYRDSSNTERLLLNATDNLANLANTATARANLGLAAVASSGSASDLTAGTLAAARIGAHASTHQTGGSDAVASVVVTPTSLAADTNDWSIGTGDIFRVAGTAARNITGIVAGTSGLAILLVNVGSFALTLKHQSASSTAANRFTVPWAGDCVLAASGGAAVLVYDSTSSTWRVV